MGIEWCHRGLGWGMWGGLGLIGLILNLMLLVGTLVVLGGGSLWLVRRLGRRAPSTATGVDPLDVARRRLAAGEITPMEFEELRERLRS